MYTHISYQLVVTHEHIKRGGSLLADRGGSATALLQQLSSQITTLLRVLIEQMLGKLQTTRFILMTKGLFFITFRKLLESLRATLRAIIFICFCLSCVRFSLY